MGGKRRSMEARRRAGKARHAARKAKDERTLKADRDGRYRVPCPNCGTAYALPESALEKRLTCKNCKSVFTPKTAMKRGRPQTKNQMKAPLIFGGVLVLAIVVIFAISGRGKEEPEAPKEPEKQYLKYSSRPVAAFRSFNEAVANKSEIGLWSHLDLAAHYDHVHRGKKPVAWAYKPDAEKNAFKETLKENLFGLDEGLVFRDFEFSTLERQELPEKPTKAPFAFNVELAPRIQGAYVDYAKLRVWTVERDGIHRVLKWELLQMPKKGRVRQDSGSGGKKERPAGVEKPKLETVTVNGKKTRIEQSEPSPLGHLDGTPPGLQRQIDTWIGLLMDPGADFRKQRDAENSLVETGKPAIPRLLNKFYETRGTDEDELIGLGLVVQTLRRLSGGNAFGFSPQMEGANAELYKKMRHKAMRSWYAWWWRNAHKKEFPPPMEEDPEFK